ncbi:MAG: ABC transporter substrate-binding protein [Spirochaetota bacterium]
MGSYNNNKTNKSILNPRNCIEENYDRNITRREFFKNLARAGLLFAGSFLFTSGSFKQKKPGSVERPGRQAQLPPVNIGYIPITDATPLLIAHAKGFYEQEGLQAGRPFLIRGWSSLAEAFMAGRFNLCHFLSPIPIYMRYQLGFPVKVVAWNHMNNSAITVAKQGPIKSEMGLGGKKIAVPYWYSIHNVIIQLVLRYYQIEPQLSIKKVDSDKCGLVVMAPPDMPAALAAGEIDGYIVAEPFNAAGELLAGGRILRFSGDVWKNHACCVAVMNENIIQNHPEWAQKVVNALVHAELWAKNNIEETAYILSRQGEGYLPFEERIIRHAMTSYGQQKYPRAIKHPGWESKRLSFQPYQYKSYTYKLVQLLKNTRLEGNTGFLKNLDPDKVGEELMDYDMVLAAVKKATGLAKFDGVSSEHPFSRKEVIEV